MAIPVPRPAGPRPVPAASRWWSGIALAVAGSVLFSGKAVIVKLAYRHGADAVSLIALRMLFALPLFALAAWWAERPSRRPGEASPWRPGDAWKVVAIGLVGYWLASFLDFLGLQYVSAGLERVILYLNPTLVLLISLAWLGRRPARREWAAMAVAYAGVLLVFGHDLVAHGAGGSGGGSGGRIWLGAGLVFLSALAYAIYLVASGTMIARLGATRLTAWASIVACLACILQSLVVAPGGMFTQAAPVYALSLLNGVACTVLPVFATMYAVARIGSGPTSQIGLVGPVSTIALAAVFLDEPVGMLQLAGTAVVLASVAGLSARRA